MRPKATDLRYFTGVLLLALSVASPSSSQEPTPIPHEDQPSYCVNHGGFADFPMEEPHICNCDKPCNDQQPEDRQCKVFCQPGHCHCIAECEREPPPIPPEG